MNKIFVFDLDNTIFSGDLQIVHSETEKLLKEIKKQNYILVLATGRGPAKLGVIAHLIHLFDYVITLNGALMTKSSNHEVLLDLYIEKEDIIKAIEVTEANEISLGMVSSVGEAITFIDRHVTYAMKGYSNETPLVDPHYYEKHLIYQLWIFHHERNELERIAKLLPQFNHFYWHYGGLDLIYPLTDKSKGVEILKKRYPNYQLICVGDGHNDYGMIKMADIGIVMDNSGFSETKKAAQLIAPHVDSNKLYDFFKENKLI